MVIKKLKSYIKNIKNIFGLFDLFGSKKIIEVEDIYIKYRFNKLVFRAVYLYLVVIMYFVLGKYSYKCQLVGEFLIMLVIFLFYYRLSIKCIYLWYEYSVYIRIKFLFKSLVILLIMGKIIEKVCAINTFEIVIGDNIYSLAFNFRETILGKLAMFINEGCYIGFIEEYYVSLFEYADPYWLYFKTHFYYYLGEDFIFMKMLSLFGGSLLWVRQRRKRRKLLRKKAYYLNKRWIKVRFLQMRKMVEEFRWYFFGYILIKTHKHPLVKRYGYLLYPVVLKRSLRKIYVQQHHFVCERNVYRRMRRINVQWRNRSYRWYFKWLLQHGHFGLKTKRGKRRYKRVFRMGMARRYKKILYRGGYKIHPKDKEMLDYYFGKVKPDFMGFLSNIGRKIQLRLRRLVFGKYKPVGEYFKRTYYRKKQRQILLEEEEYFEEEYDLAKREYGVIDEEEDDDFIEFVYKEKWFGLQIFRLSTILYFIGGFFIYWFFTNNNRNFYPIMNDKEYGDIRIHNKEVINYLYKERLYNYFRIYLQEMYFELLYDELDEDVDETSSYDDNISEIWVLISVIFIVIGSIFLMESYLYDSWLTGLYGLNLFHMVGSGVIGLQSYLMWDYNGFFLFENGCMVIVTYVGFLMAGISIIYLFAEIEEHDAEEEEGFEEEDLDDEMRDPEEYYLIPYLMNEEDGVRSWKDLSEDLQDFDTLKCIIYYIRLSWVYDRNPDINIWWTEPRYKKKDYLEKWILPHNIVVINEDDVSVENRNIWGYGNKIKKE